VLLLLLLLLLDSGLNESLEVLEVLLVEIGHVLLSLLFCIWFGSAFGGRSESLTFSTTL
jgi:hypothetical protein